MQGRVVVATKAVGRGEHVQHIRGGNVGLKSESLMQACEQSLVRLGVECIDLYQVHWPDRPTNYFGQLGYKIPQQPRDEGAPIHETLEALTRLIGQGKVRAVGISNETPWGTMRYLDLARELGLTRIVTIQNPYNLLNRTFEVGLAEICHRESLGLLAYSPLAFGVLSGKYRGGVKPEGSRLALYSRFTRYTNPQADAAVEAYAALASESGYSMTQLALSFVYSRPFVVSSLIGGATVAQLQENLEASMLMLPKEILKKLDEIHQRHPNPCP
jgi:aryl-alcohol dehydrogenase-like predicted oxidoreductase